VGRLPRTGEHRNADSYEPWVLLEPLLTRAGNGDTFCAGVRRVFVHDRPIDEREEGPAMNLLSSDHRGRTPRRGALDRSGVTNPRLDVVAELRRAAFYAETAALLARRAERCDSPALAAVLSDRAEGRRRAAERPLAHLMHVVTVAGPRGPQDGRRAGERL
jgi:hypothetical protein